MTNPFTDAAVWLLLAALWWMFYWPYRQYQIDKTRHRLFAIRDALFDAAAKESCIRFEDRAYGLTRTTLNGMLRTLEDHTPFTLLCLLWRYSHHPAWQDLRAYYERENEVALGELSAEGRELIHRTARDATRTLLEYVSSTSLLMLAVRLVLALLRRTWGWPQRVRDVVRNLTRAMDYESSLAGREDLRSLGRKAAA